jgi:hypothetical protein
MQHLICPFERRPSCKKCSIQEHCPYFLLFEEQSSLPGQMEATRGYVLYPPVSRQDDISTLYVTLFGDCGKFLPVMAKAIFNGCDSGIGKDRIPYRVEGWEQILPGGHSIPLPLNLDGYLSAADSADLRSWLSKTPRRFGRDHSIAFEIQTPLRLRKQGRYMGSMDGSFLLATIARRLEALCCHYNSGHPIGRNRWLELSEQFKLAGELTGKLEWKDYARYSQRQKTKVPMGGLVGKAFINSAPEWLPEWLYAANLVHVGKGTAMGLGRIKI